MKPLTPKVILVPTDFSAPAAHALRYAAALGERFGAHLLVIYADPFMPAIDFTISAAGTFDLARQELVETAREQLQAFAETNITSAVPYDIRVLAGTPTDAIVAQVRQAGANLIVMGTHGRSGVRRLLFGSVTEAVMRLASVPVIAVTQSTPESAGMSVALGRVTHTPETRAALRYAAALTGGENSRFVLYRAPDIAGRPATVDDVHALDLLVPEELRERSTFRLVLSSGAADMVETARAECADLIVLGISGDRSFGDALIGTVAERVVQHGACPVLTVNAVAARSLGAVAVSNECAVPA